MKKTLVFLGTKPIGYRCLEYLILHADALNLKITAIHTQERNEFSNEYNLSSLAEKSNIPTLTSIDEIPSCDIIYSVQYHQLLLQRHIDKASQIAVNLHMAPLPTYRGCNQFTFAILDNAKEFGNTIHEIDCKIDNGAILFESRFPIPEECWVENLYNLTTQDAFSLFQKTLPQIIKGNYTKTSQSQLLSRGTQLHLRDEIKTIKQIDITQPRETIERTIRAVSMPGFEPPFFYINNQKVYITKNTPST